TLVSGLGSPHSTIEPHPLRVLGLLSDETASCKLSKYAHQFRPTMLAAPDFRQQMSPNFALTSSQIQSIIQTETVDMKTKQTDLTTYDLSKSTHFRRPLPSIGACN